MALVKIEPPRKDYSYYYRDRFGHLQHKSSGIPHSPDGATAQERKERRETNYRIAVATVNDLETAERGNSTVPFIKKLFNAAMQRAMGVYQQNGTRGMSPRGYLEAWLKLQDHLNEGRKIYQGYINSFCDYLGDPQHDSLFLLERRTILGFIDSQQEKGLAASTINNKLAMLQTAFADAEKRALMLCNIVADDDFLDEEKLQRKPLLVEQFDALYERWEYLGRQDTEMGARSLEWITASRLARYEGMRLGDATNQLRGNFDLANDKGGTVTWMPEKTEHLKRIVILPLHSRMRAHVLQWREAPPDRKLTPLLSAIKRPELCTAFKQELIATGIDPEEIKSFPRSFCAVSFHSHKHHYQDCLHKALVPEERRKYLTAHTSDSIKAYEHAWTKKQAEALQPDIEHVL